MSDKGLIRRISCGLMSHQQGYEKGPLGLEHPCLYHPLRRDAKSGQVDPKKSREEDGDGERGGTFGGLPGAQIAPFFASGQGTYASVLSAIERDK